MVAQMPGCIVYPGQFGAKDIQSSTRALVHAQIATIDPLL
jgi:hypothetical protein